jgi:hypothetical protein
MTAPTPHVPHNASSTTDEAQGEPGGPGKDPLLPHERDEGHEAGGMTGGVPSEVVQQGARDVARGIEDTSRAAEADRTYEHLKQKP